MLVIWKIEQAELFLFQVVQNHSSPVEMVRVNLRILYVMDLTTVETTVTRNRTAVRTSCSHTLEIAIVIIIIVGGPV